MAIIQADPVFDLPETESPLQCDKYTFVPAASFH